MYSTGSSGNSASRSLQARGVWVKSNKLCHCGEYTTLKISNQPESKWRVFHGCPNYVNVYNKGCGYFEWAISLSGREESIEQIQDRSERRMVAMVDEMKVALKMAIEEACKETKKKSSTETVWHSRFTMIVVGILIGVFSWISITKSSDLRRLY